MTAKPMTTEELVERYLQLQKQRDDLVAEMEVIKDTVRASLPIGKHETPAGTATLSPNRRFDDATARAVLSAAEVKACTAPKLDAGLVKKLVAPFRYEQCMKDVGDPKVAIA